MIKNNIIYTPFLDWRFKLKKAQGCYIWDQFDNKLIDFTSGWNVTNLGWNNQEIIEAAILQMKKNSFTPMWASEEISEEYADLLKSCLPAKIDVFAKATGGMEANEEAIKTARAYTGKKKIIGFLESYHGQGLTCMPLGYLPEWIEKISNSCNDVIQIKYPCLSSTDNRQNQENILLDFLRDLEEVLSKRDIAGIVTEAGIISGWGSVNVASSGFLRGIRDLTKKYNTLLILDEVGTGFSRCGKLFGFQIEGVEPDIITFAKGISNGTAPIGVMASTKEIIEKTLQNTNLQSTFGWNPVSCAAALKTLEIHLRDKVSEKAYLKGNLLMKLLKEKLKGNPYIKDIRGIGLEIGIEMSENFEQCGSIDNLVELAYKKGLHILSDHSKVLQLMPPLIIEKDVLEKGMEILLESINTFTILKHGKK